MATTSLYSFFWAFVHLNHFSQAHHIPKFPYLWRVCENEVWSPYGQMQEEPLRHLHCDRNYLFCQGANGASCVLALHPVSAKWKQTHEFRRQVFWQKRIHPWWKYLAPAAPGIKCRFQGAHCQKLELAIRGPSTKKQTAAIRILPFFPCRSRYGTFLNYKKYRNAVP